MTTGMNNKIFYLVSAGIAVALIALSFVWPQGLGAPSPKPFGHAIELPDYFRMLRERDARQKHEAADKAQRAAQAAASSSAASASAGYTITATARTAEKREALRQSGITAIDPTDSDALTEAVRLADGLLITPAPTDDGCPAFDALAD
eukprot:gene18691-23627_t